MNNEAHVEVRNKIKSEAQGCGCIGSGVMRATAEENLRLRNELVELKLKMKADKKMHKAVIRYRDRKDAVFVCLVCAIILYGVVANCVSVHVCHMWYQFF